MATLEQISKPTFDRSQMMDRSKMTPGGRVIFDSAMGVIDNPQSSREALDRAAEQTGVGINYGTQRSYRLGEQANRQALAQEQQRTAQNIGTPGPAYNRRDGAVGGTTPTGELDQQTQIAQTNPTPMKIGGEGGFTESPAQVAARLQAQGIAPASFPGGETNISDRFLEGAQNAITAGATSPTDTQGAVDMLGNYLPSQEGTGQTSSFITQDPYLNSVMAAYQGFMSQQNQRTSLVQEYQNLLKASGVQELDLELINLKNIIEGTEDDIRTEVTKAGGFATDSQVIALGNARNKQLIKNYNTLLETRNAKEKYLDTMMGLTALDRQAADKQFDTMMNFGFKIAEINQTMKKNAIDTLTRTAEVMGWDGVLEATQGDPQLQRQIESVYGLPTGGLQITAQRQVEERAFAKQERELDIQLKKAQIDKIYNEISATTSHDPSEILAYSQQYASTGMIPTGMPKGTFGLVSQTAKVIPKPVGTFVDTSTGVKSSTAGAAQEDAMASLYDITKKIDVMRSEFEKMPKGLIGGSLGTVFGFKSTTNYLATRKEIVDLLARARTGAVITKEEEKFYSSMLPSQFNKPIGVFGKSGKDLLNKFEENMKSILDSKLKATSLSIYGYSKVKIGEQEYVVGDVVENVEGITGRILPDGSVFYSE